MTVKVGDKVRVTTDDYLSACPRGTICNVIWVSSDGTSIRARIEDCDGSEWLFRNYEYELIDDVIDKTGASIFAELAGKHGIKITVNLASGASVIFDGTK